MVTAHKSKFLMYYSLFFLYFAFNSLYINTVRIGLAFIRTKEQVSAKNSRQDIYIFEIRLVGDGEDLFGCCCCWFATE